MSRVRRAGKIAAELLLRPLGVRMVAADWGPRGYVQCFRRMRMRGVIPATIIDVGASDGRWTGECRSVFPDAGYALFDPLPENRAALERLADDVPSISVWNGALGAQCGRLRLHAHGDQSSYFGSDDFSGEPIDVEMRTLDSFLEPMAFKGPMLIKADVQGYELEVLRGAARCLEMTEVLLLELSFRQTYRDSPLAHDVIAEVARAGFRIYDICSYAQYSGSELDQADVVFARANSALFS